MPVDDLRYALDPALFATECLNIQPDPWQAKVLRSEHKWALLNCSRQSGKSLVAAIRALHCALFYVLSLVLLVSASQRQSSELFRKITDLIKLLPIKPRLLEDNKLSLQLENGSRIISLPGQEASIRGFSRATLIVEDEASRVCDDLYRAIRPMLAVSGGRLLLLSTPFGKRGHFYEEWTNGKGWEKVIIPATECPRISPEFLEQEKHALGEWWFQQEYMCEFVAVEDQIFNHDEIMEALDDDIKPLSLF